MIYVFYCAISVDFQKTLFDDLLFTVPEAMQKKIKRYRNWEDQQAGLLGKLLIRQGFLQLGHSDPLPKITYNPYGKPYVEGGLDFNISHAGKLAICAVSEGSRIGIDIEDIRTIDQTVFSSQFAPEEWQEISSRKGDLPFFYQYWTKKEAVIKAIGKGMYTPLQSINVQHNHTQVDGENWCLRRLQIDDQSVCHLAVNCEKETMDDVSILKMETKEFVTALSK